MGLIGRLPKKQQDKALQMMQGNAEMQRILQTMYQTQSPGLPNQ